MNHDSLIVWFLSVFNRTSRVIVAPWLHNLFVQVGETVKCQINTTILKQFLMSVVCVFFVFPRPGTPSTGTPTWSASSTWTLWVGSSARPSLWTERPTRSTTSPSSPWRAVSSLQAHDLIISVRVYLSWAPSPSSSKPDQARQICQALDFSTRSSVLRIWSNKSKKSQEWIKQCYLTIYLPTASLCWLPPLLRSWLLQPLEVAAPKETFRYGS